MTRSEKVELLTELSRVAYWYAERTGDYQMHSLFEEDEEAMLIAERLISGDELVEFKPGDRIAQMLIQDVYQRDVMIVDELPDTERGNGGFGSTGR